MFGHRPHVHRGQGRGLAAAMAQQRRALRPAPLTGERERVTLGGMRRWILSALALVFLGFLFYELPILFVSTDAVPNAAKRLGLRNDVRTAFAQLLAGCVLAVGLVFTARTYRVAREGQITERFSKAIEH